MPNLTRRGLLIGGATVAAVALTPELAHAATETGSVPFTLNATVLDGGEQVASLTLDTSALGPIDPSSLSAATFTVHAKSRIPWTTTDLVFTQYDADRPVTKAYLDHGKIVLELQTIDQTTLGGTLGYMVRAGRNVLMDLTYTLTQNAPLTLLNHRSLVLPGVTQGKLLDPEVDAYSYHTHANGMNYRLFSPTQGGGAERSVGEGKRPLVVWLHGGGEGGLLSQNYYDNEPTLRANRGALGFSTPEAQRVFKGAYVVAPQAETAWMADGPGYAPRVKAIIDDLVARYPIDASRILVVGCSNGGYMSLYMSWAYQGFFAGSVPICPGASTRYFTDAQLQAITTPTWIVQAANDTTLPPPVNGLRAHALVPGSLMSFYDNVTWNGISYPGHWSWIYVARNDPYLNGQHIWQWMASQRLATS
jgi:predicted peptidase